MKNRTILAAILAVGVVIAAPFAFAQHRRAMAGGFGDGMMFGHRLQKAQQALGLTDDQVSQIQAIFTDLRTQNQPYRQSMRGGMQSIVQTLLANPNDTAAAQALMDQQSTAERQIKLNTLNAVSKAINVLNADQRAKLNTFVQDRIARHNANANR